MTLPAALAPLDADAVAALHRNFAVALERQLDRAMGPEGAADAERREALRCHVLTGAKLGRMPEPEGLLKLGRLSAAEIARETARLRDPLPALSRKLIDLAARWRDSLARYDDVFGDGNRFYLPLQSAGPSPVEARVAALLEAQGYTVTDYRGGYATDAAGKQRFRIGKLLSKLDSALYEDFQNDASRAGDRLLLCLSRDPMDIARMSTGRGWWSCMSRGSFNFGYVKHDVHNGSLVAYLVRDSDPDVTRPLARILLKPYLGRGGNRVFMAGPSYGLENRNFVHTAGLVAETLSADAPTGRYRMRRGLYQDGMPPVRLVLPAEMTAEGVLETVKARWGREADGHLHVYGDLNLSYCGLTRLPDLTEVRVHGDFRCVSNCLTDAVGMPQQVDGAIDLRWNRLTALKGMPAVAAGNVDVSDNPLLSLVDAPHTVGGSFDASDCQLISLVGAPQQVGGSFLVRRNALATLEGAPAEVRGDFDCSSNELTSLAHGPRSIAWGGYDCSHNRLDDLVGAPPAVHGDFDCSHNALQDLTGAPREVGGTMFAYGPSLQTLHGMPDSLYRLRWNGVSYRASVEVPDYLLKPWRAPAAMPNGFSCTGAQGKMRP